MGAAGSYLGSGQSYSQRAVSAKQLPEAILSYFFSQLDLLDLISLQSLGDCEKYIFTTSKALDTVFTKLQVRPERGRNGEIYFVPLKRVVPRASTSERLSVENQKSLGERKKERDRLCLDISYFYVRIFQIYAALALTTMNTDPMRKPLTTNPYGKGYSRSAPLMSGGALSEAALVKLFQTTELVNKSKQRPFNALRNLLVGYTPKGARELSNDFIQLDVSLGNVKILIDINSIKTAIQSTETYDSYTGTIMSSESNRRDIMIRLEKIQGAEPIQYTLSFDGQNVLTLINDRLTGTYKVQGQTLEQSLKDWISYYATEFSKNLSSSSSSSSSGPSIPQLPVSNYFARPSSAPGLGSGSSGFVSAGVSVAPAYQAPALSSSSMYEQGDYGTLFKLYSDRYSQKEFPKAYCIARAMTLLNPIFMEELPNRKTPFSSQIFLRKDFDFERALGREFMPRLDKQVKTVIYFRSLVGLYYDDFQMAGDKVLFTQTETGRTELREASKLVAKLYDITQEPETFLDSSRTFRALPLQDKFADRRIIFNNMNLYNQLRNEVILPMLKLQDTHNQNVNSLLKQMFNVKFKSQGGAQVLDTMTLQPSLKSGGINGLNAIGKKARDLLLSYYLKSEALYFKGVYILVENQKFWQVG